MNRKIYASKCMGNEKKLIMKIHKTNGYTNHNRCDVGTFLFQMSFPAENNMERRLIDIKCAEYKGALTFSATDLIPNNSKIGIYFVKSVDTVDVYVSGERYGNLSMALIDCDNPCVYEFLPYSIETLKGGATYFTPNNIPLIKEVKIGLFPGISLTGASGTLNKLFYNANTKMVTGELALKPDTTGYHDIMSCEAFIQTSNANEALLYKAYAFVDKDGDGNEDTCEVFLLTWSRAENKLSGIIPKGTKRILLSVNTYLPEGLLQTI